MREKQRRFVERFLRTGDAEAARVEAGYLSPWTVERVLSIPAIRTYLQGVGETSMVANRMEVAAFLSLVMRGKETDKDQLKAAELLGKHFGMFEKRENQSAEEPVEFVGDERIAD